MGMSLVIWVEVAGFCINDVLKEEWEEKTRYQRELECVFKPYIYYNQHRDRKVAR
jgi:hypothetical protein